MNTSLKQESALSEEEINEKSTKLQKLADQNKQGYLKKSDDLNSFTSFKMALEPIKISNETYEKMKEISKLWQKITHLTSQDSDLISKVFKNVTKDPFITPLFKIYLQIENSKKNSQNKKLKRPKLELFRTDYFVTDDETNNIKIIEYNCVSVSLTAMSQSFVESQAALWENKKNILPNESNKFYAKELAKAYSDNGLDGIMVVVGQENEINVFDQDGLFSEIKRQSNFQIEKVLLKNLDEETYLDSNNDLFLNNGKKVSFVYYRSAYTSTEPISWKGFHKCHMSSAINIPEISSFLVNTKKMQFELSKREVMLKYLTEEETDLLFSSVIDGWEMKDDTDKLKVLEIIEKEGAKNFILKPNEDGGKNNIFGEKVVDKLNQLKDEDLQNYILTRRIIPKSQKNHIVPNEDNGEVILESEISLYGFISTKTEGEEGKENLRNVCDGYLIRSKIKGADESGLIKAGGSIGSLEIDKNQ